MSSTTGISVLALTVTLVVGAAGGEDAICVYVYAGDARASFVDPEAKDSARDLTEALRKKKIVRIVVEKDRADVWVRVEKRFKRETGGGVVAGAVIVPNDEHVVQATLGAGDFTSEIAGTNEWGWKRAAGNLANKIANWVAENREQLLSQRSKK